MKKVFKRYERYKSSSSGKYFGVFKKKEDLQLICKEIDNTLESIEILTNNAALAAHGITDEEYDNIKYELKLMF